MRTNEDSKKELLKVPVGLIVELGATAAYVLKELAYRQGGATEKRAGKLWFFCPQARRSKLKADSEAYRPLSDLFPWLSAGAVHKVVRKLEAAKLIKVGRGQNRWSADNTLWYHVPEKVCKRCVDLPAEDLRWFDPVEAKELTLNAALVLNVIYREFRLRVKREDQRLVFSRRAIAKDLGLPRSTVVGVFKELEAEGYLSPFDTLEGKAYRLMVPNPCTLKAAGAGRKSVSTLVYVVESGAVKNPSAMKITPVLRPAHHMTPIQMAEEFYLVMLEREAIEAQKAKPVVKKVQKRRRGSKPVGPNSFKSTRGYHAAKRAENAIARSDDALSVRCANARRREQGKGGYYSRKGCTLDKRVEQSSNQLALAS